MNFGGGQVDITNGKFVFSASEAYLIEDGKITAPVKNATLIGTGPESLKYVSMVGNDLQLDVRAWAPVARRDKVFPSVWACQRSSWTR